MFSRLWLRLRSPVAWLRAFRTGRSAPPRQSTASSLGSLGGGRRRKATLGRHGFGYVAIFAVRVWIWVWWDDSNACSGPHSRLSESARGEPVRSQGFPILADNIHNELARVLYSVGKSGHVSV